MFPDCEVIPLQKIFSGYFVPGGIAGRLWVPYMFSSNVLSMIGMVRRITNSLSITMGVILITLLYFQMSSVSGSYDNLKRGVWFHFGPDLPQ